MTNPTDEELGYLRNRVTWKVVFRPICLIIGHQYKHGKHFCASSAWAHEKICVLCNYWNWDYD